MISILINTSNGLQGFFSWKHPFQGAPTRAQHRKMGRGVTWWRKFEKSGIPLNTSLKDSQCTFAHYKTGLT